MRKNSFGSWLLVAFAALAVLAGGMAFAQEQAGTIEGIVADKAGAPLPGVTVEAIGQWGNTVAVTDGKGFYRFPSMRSGVYKLMAKLDGFVTAEVANVDLVVGSTLRVNFTLQPGTFEDTITVAADTVNIDVSKTSTATNISREQIDLMPHGRDFTSVVVQAAGVRNERQAGGISIDGSTGLENRFIIDGIDTTDPQTGESAVPMRADFFEEVQVKSAGYAAEYGGSTGGVINAITRSGSSEFKGGVSIDYQDDALNGSERPTLQYNDNNVNIAEHETYPKDNVNRIDPGLWLAGPIVKDRLFFFAAYQPGIEATKRTVTFEGAGDNGEDITDTYKTDYNVDYISFNVSANLGPVLLKLGGNLSPYETKRYLPGKAGLSGVYDQDSYKTGDKGERSTYSLTADYVVTDSFVLSGRAGYYKTNNEATNVPPPPAIQTAYTGASVATTPAAWQHGSGWASYIIQSATQRNIYTRKAAALDGSFFFTAAGDHTAKIGFQQEQISNDVLDGWNVPQQRYFWNRSYTTTGGQTVRGQYGYIRLRLFQTAGKVESTNDAIFVQDSWRIGRNFTLNYGVRAEHERVPNYGVGAKYAVDFKYADKVAPRLGLAWDPMGDQKWKVYGSYGDYYDVMKYELPRGSFGGDKWVDYLFKLDNSDPGVNQIPSCTSGPNTIEWQPVCPGGTFIELNDRRHNAAAYNLIDPDLKPMKMWETQIGLERQLTDRIQLGARFVHKQLVRAIEDHGTLVPGIGEVYYITNPGYGISQTIATKPFPKAERKYDALELTFKRRFADNWMFNAGYTYSRLIGSYAGLASSDEENGFGGGARLSPNASRLYDSILNSFDRNGKAVYGHLATERPHQFNFNGLYRFPFNLSVGVSQYVTSGTPISENALGPSDIAFYPYGRGNLGRTPWIYQTDLALIQDVKFGSFDLQFGLNVSNLLDTKTVTRVWSTRNRTGLPLSEDEFFAGGWDYEALIADLGESGLDPAFLKVDNYQAPREIRLSVKFQF